MERLRQVSKWQGQKSIFMACSVVLFWGTLHKICTFIRKHETKPSGMVSGSYKMHMVDKETCMQDAMPQQGVSPFGLNPGLSFQVLVRHSNFRGNNVLKQT